jgi:hypothetical protein
MQRANRMFNGNNYDILTDRVGNISPCVYCDWNRFLLDPTCLLYEDRRGQTLNIFAISGRMLIVD